MQKKTTMKVLQKPSGDAPEQSVLPGTEIAEMAEHQGEILKRVVTQKTVDKRSAVGDLSALYGILEGLAKKTVITVFAMGKILNTVKEDIPHGQFGDFLKANCPFDTTTAWRYMKIYDHYKDIPTRELTDLSLGQAYADAGIKKLAAPQKQDAIGQNTDDTADFGLPKIEEFSRLLKTPPASGVNLKRYRVACLEDGKIHAISEGLGIYPVSEIYLPRFLDKPDARMAFEQLQKDLCIAFEMYYVRIEQLEDSGLLPKPDDLRFSAAVRKSRGIVETPKAERKAPARKRSTK